MQKIIFTDLDGTLTLKDTYTKFILQNLKLGVVLKNLPTLAMMLIRHKLKVYNDDDVKMVTFSMFFTGYDRETPLDGFAESAQWNHKVLRRIEEKRKEGYKVIIVTASPDIYVDYVCNYLGYDGYICTKTVDAGRYLDGAFDGKVCNFEEKPKRILEFLDGKKPEHTISYGNSAGDFAMLEFCDESYFVNKLDIKRYEKQ